MFQIQLNLQSVYVGRNLILQAILQNTTYILCSFINGMYLLDCSGIMGFLFVGSEFLTVTDSSGISMSLHSSHNSKFITY